MGATSSKEASSDVNAKGVYELQYFNSGNEAEESAQEWTNCRKDPGHYRFIPLQHFHVSHLPDHLGPYKHDAFEAIKCLAALTVRVRVNYGSGKRLAHWPQSVTGRRSSVGTGCIREVGEIRSKIKCECQHVGKPTPDQPWEVRQKKRWLVRIATAAHVLFNDEEAEYASVDLFFDREECRYNGNIVSLKVVHVEKVRPDADFCIFHCVTDNDDLAIQLQELRRQFNQHNLTLQQAIELKKLKDKNYIIIVSHPHGQSKYITIGRKAKLPIGCQPHGLLEQCGYTTSTCAGSSGAVVFLMGHQNHLFSDLGRVHTRGFNGGVNVSNYFVDLENKKKKKISLIMKFLTSDIYSS